MGQILFMVLSVLQLHFAGRRLSKNCHSVDLLTVILVILDILVAYDQKVAGEAKTIPHLRTQSKQSA